MRALTLTTKHNLILQRFPSTQWSWLNYYRIVKPKGERIWLFLVDSNMVWWYGSFKIRINNIPTALICLILMTFIAEYLWLNFSIVKRMKLKSIFFCNLTNILLLYCFIIIFRLNDFNHLLSFFLSVSNDEECSLWNEVRKN